MDVVFACFLLIVSLTGAFSVLVHWLRHAARGSAAVDQPPSPIPPPKLGAVIFDSDSDLIRVPEDLKTREEIVAWMTNELPKLVEEKIKTMPKSKFL
jgi:hypothetical protein